MRNRARHAGFKSVKEDRNYGEANVKFLTMTPEEFDLPGVDKKVRQRFNRMLRNDKIRRKGCIMSRCNAKAGQQEFKRKQSVYCRRHYRKAKEKLAGAQERALRIMVILKKE